MSGVDGRDKAARLNPLKARDATLVLLAPAAISWHEYLDHRIKLVKPPDQGVNYNNVTIPCVRFQKQVFILYASEAIT